MSGYQRSFEAEEASLRLNGDKHASVGMLFSAIASNVYYFVAFSAASSTIL
nr:uncharacterized protein CTRU02_10850 [Colletotrichum truncatum]KAF6786726.1 hypothetical protein CTRU02_10850 [Colletotrichum truncatum]